MGLHGDMHDNPGDTPYHRSIWTDVNVGMWVMWFFILLTVGLGIWFVRSTADSQAKYQLQWEQVAGRKDVGKIESLTLHNGNFSVSTTTVVNTTKGTYTVYGRFSYTKGDSVYLETRGTGDQLLCIAHKCNRLAR